MDSLRELDSVLLDVCEYSICIIYMADVSSRHFSNFFWFVFSGMIKASTEDL